MLQIPSILLRNMVQMRCDLHFLWALLVRSVMNSTKILCFFLVLIIKKCFLVHRVTSNFLQDLNLSTERLMSNKALTNKLWNAGKFILQNLPNRSDVSAWEQLLAYKVSFCSLFSIYQFSTCTSDDCWQIGGNPDIKGLVANDIILQTSITA